MTVDLKEDILLHLLQEVKGLHHGENEDVGIFQIISQK